VLAHAGACMGPAAEGWDLLYKIAVEDVLPYKNEDVMMDQANARNDKREPGAGRGDRGRA